MLADLEDFMDAYPDDPKLALKRYQQHLLDGKLGTKVFDVLQRKYKQKREESHENKDRMYDLKGVLHLPKMGMRSD